MTDSTAPLVDRAVAQLVDVITHWRDTVAQLDHGRPRVHDDRVVTEATVVVGGLTDPDDHTRAESLISLIPWLGPDTIPASESWWTTPLGLLAAAAQQPGDDVYVTQHQAADAIGVDVSTVRRWIDAGRVRARGGGPTGGRLVSRSDAAAEAVAREP